MTNTNNLITEIIKLVGQKKDYTVKLACVLFITSIPFYFFSWLIMNTLLHDVLIMIIFFSIAIFIVEFILWKYSGKKTIKALNILTKNELRIIHLFLNKNTNRLTIIRSIWILALLNRGIIKVIVVNAGTSEELFDCSLTNTIWNYLKKKKNKRKYFTEAEENNQEYLKSIEKEFNLTGEDIDKEH